MEFFITTTLTQVKALRAFYIVGLGPRIALSTRIILVTYKLSVYDMQDKAAEVRHRPAGMGVIVYLAVSGSSKEDGEYGLCGYVKSTSYLAYLSTTLSTSYIAFRYLLISAKAVSYVYTYLPYLFKV